MEKPKEILEIFKNYTPSVDKEIKLLLTRGRNLPIYDMMSYFLGYLDENFKKVKGYGGKHFRSGLCLLLSDFYGKKENALEVATSIEVFHNFTLIHDDIEDCDPMRRGRPTVWKLWGINHGINTGDAQLVLANIELSKAVKKYPKVGLISQEFLNERYLEVAEGQYLDFVLSEKSISDSFITEKNYMEMITKKSGVLVGTAAKTAGIITNQNKKECNLLWEYGLNLGLAYQLNDDLISIWGRAEKTGKVEAKDIEERKKTLPVIYLYQNLDEKLKNKFAKIYDSEGILSHDEISEVKSLLSENLAHDYVWAKIRKYLEKSEKAIQALSITENQKNTLVLINKALIPDMKWWNA